MKKKRGTKTVDSGPRPKDVRDVAADLWEAMLKVKGIGFLLEHSTTHAFPPDESQIMGVGMILSRLGDELDRILDAIEK